ncbi:alanine/glycine:cation symporter family protein [Shouchella shacheensis]|uniref:alanine/glycine:cation symporter family protein n=1 Tax=Shouchella shacheensis TaxID=1649580 RepID=UPI00073FE952|nr:alanine/glycine:cation symporter family protein [Shouchella shacheensis]
METVTELVGSINDFLSTYILIALLIGVGLFFSIRTRFVQLTMFSEMLRVIFEKKKKKGEISAFQAFSISTANRVGSANIAGVALAIASGGPGAVFWMWVVAAIGMATGFIESMLAQVYKVREGDQFRGGPAYYIEKALGMRWLGVLFAVLIAVTFGIIFASLQANTLSNAMDEAFGIDVLVVGVAVALLTAVIIFGGVQRISRMTSIIVPIMTVFYLIVVFYVLLTNLSALPSMFMLIVSEAFGLREAGTGIIMGAILEGTRRGLFSNEAGMGSIPNAAAAAHVSHPVKQGLVQSLGVFFDTIVICSATAFVILLSDVYQTGGANGVALTQASLSDHLGGWAVAFVAIAIFFFAFSSVLGAYYIGETNLQFIKRSTRMLQLYRLAVVCMVVVGSVISIELAWNLADVFMVITAAVNLVAIALMSKIALSVLQDYKKQKKSGIKEPVFYAKNVRGLRGAECWEDASGEKREQA